jgi:hypothetical protein
MANTNHRTWQKHSVGHFMLSVHLDPVADGHCFEREQELARLTQQLIDLTDAQSLPATWAVSDPAYSAATPSILRSAVNHELAILGDVNWLGPMAGRTRFARELARRVSHARDAGIPVTTLVPRVAPVERHIDLVVKQRITAVSGFGQVWSGARGRQTRVAPRALHYGVWELPVSGGLPTGKHWLLPSGWFTWRQIWRAASDAATYHLAIDAPALLEEGERGVQTVGWLVRRVALLRTRGLLRVETLGAAAARLANVPLVSPQQSILRRAA